MDSRVRLVGRVAEVQRFAAKADAPARARFLLWGEGTLVEIGCLAADAPAVDADVAVYATIGVWDGRETFRVVKIVPAK